jgi:hypothetical protein
MIIWEVKFTGLKQLEDKEVEMIKNTIIENGELVAGVDIDDIMGSQGVICEDGFYYVGISDTMHVGALDFERAYSEANSWLDNELAEFDIMGITKKEDVKLMNWPETEEEQCNCIYCRYEKCAVEDRVTFVCTCGKEIKIAGDEPWDRVQCVQCGRVIEKNNLIETSKMGYFSFIDLSGLEGKLKLDDGKDL